MKNDTHDDTGSGCYTAEEVKEMADLQGLPCRVINANGMLVIHPISTLETLGLIREWSRFYKLGGN